MISIKILVVWNSTQYDVDDIERELLELDFYSLSVIRTAKDGNASGAIFRALFYPSNVSKAEIRNALKDITQDIKIIE